MDIAARERQECPRNSLDMGEEDNDDDSQSYMDEEAVREVRLHHWLSETALSTRLALESAPALARADSPLLGFEHFQGSESDDKPLPGLPPSVSRLRTSSIVSSTHTAHAHPHPHPQPHPQPPPVTAAAHRRSQAISQLSFPAHASRPSVSYAESTRSPQHTPGRSSRLGSISSSLSLASARNAVYIDSKDITTRLDELLTTGNPDLDEDGEDDYGDVTEYYATSFDHRDSPTMNSIAPSGLQAVPPNTPMTAYYKTPQASSSQIYLGKSTPALFKKQVAEDTDATTTVTGHERSTPVPHGRPHARDNSKSSMSFTSSSSGSPEGSPVFSTPASLTSQTSVSVSQFSVAGASSRAHIPGTLSPKPSFASLSNMKTILSPRPSLASLAAAGLQNQNQDSVASSGLLSPPEATASRWSLTSSVAGDMEERKRKEKGSKRKRLVSMISRFTGKDTKQQQQADPQTPTRPTTQIDSLAFSVDTDTELAPPPVPPKPKLKPPSLKLVLSNSSSMTNLRSLTSQVSHYPSLRSPPLSPINSATPKTTTTTSPPPPLPTPGLITSPQSATFTISSGNSPITTPTSASTPSTMTMTHIRPAPMSRSTSSATVPTLKSAVSVPALLPAWEGRPFVIKRENSAGWISQSSSSRFGSSGGESMPTSPIGEDQDEVDGAEYYVRELGLSNAVYGNLRWEEEEGEGEEQRDENDEEKRKERLSVIVDLLMQQESQASTTKTPPMQGQAVVPQSPEKPQAGARKLSEEDGQWSIGAGGAPSPAASRRSFSSPAPPQLSPSPTATQAPSNTSPARSSLRIFAARMGISTSPSSPSNSTSSSSLEHTLSQSFARRKRKLLLLSPGHSKRKGLKKQYLHVAPCI